MIQGIAFYFSFTCEHNVAEVAVVLEARYYYLHILCTLRFYYQMRDMPYAKYHQHHELQQRM